jgi:hypothetical protein
VPPSASLSYTSKQLLSITTTNSLLLALSADISALPHSYQLAGVLQQQYPLPLLPLDIWNIVSLELIQAPESLTEVLFVVFQGRKQLCIDVQVSELLKFASLTELLAGLKVEQVSEEVVLALLWDTPPSAQAILGVLTRITKPVEIRSRRLQTAGMVVGRQLVALGVVPCDDGVSLQGYRSKLDVSVPVCLKTLLHWELKPDLIMLKDSCPPLLPPLDSSLLSDLEALSKHAEEIQLVAPVPSIVLGDGKEIRPGEFDEKYYNERTSFEVNAEEESSAKATWACDCGSANPQSTRTCSSCGQRRALQIEVHERHSSTDTCAQCKALKAQLDDGKACPACGVTNRTTARICKSCFVAFSTSLTAGEWSCVACKMNNSASRTYCAGCYASKGQEAQGSPESRWTCDNCQTVNLKGLSRCKNCLLKPGAVSVVTWTCRKCHFSNSSEANSCRACSSSREIAASVAETARTEGPDYWTCWSCKGLNLPEKSRCRKCGNSRSSDQVALDYSPPSEEVKICLNCSKPVTGRGSFCATCLHSEPKPTWTCSNCNTLNSAGYCSKCFRRPK